MCVADLHFLLSPSHIYHDWKEPSRSIIIYYFTYFIILFYSKLYVKKYSKCIAKQFLHTRDFSTTIFLAIIIFFFVNE